VRVKNLSVSLRTKRLAAEQRTSMRGYGSAFAFGVYVVVLASLIS
jgi:hypothetical protein